jgi:hypothetical protein
MMFAVLGYQKTNSDVLAALKTARHHLAPDGLLILDVWYGPAILVQRPEPRVSEFATSDGRIVRSSSAVLDSLHHLCTVQYHLSHVCDGKIVKDQREEHTMRYFFPMEIQLFLEVAGFQMLQLSAFPEFLRQPDETTWNALVVASAVKKP